MIIFQKISLGQVKTSAEGFASLQVVWRSSNSWKGFNICIHKQARRHNPRNHRHRPLLPLVPPAGLDSDHPNCPTSSPSSTSLLPSNSSTWRCASVLSLGNAFTRIMTTSKVLRTFPPDLTSDLPEVVVVSLFEGVNRWKEELHSQKNSKTRSELSREVKRSAPPYIASFPPSGGVSESAGTCQDDPIFGFSSRGTRTSSKCTADFDSLNSSPLSKPRDEDAAADTAPVPFVSSMTWTSEKQKGKGSKVAVVTLKMQDHSNSPVLEKEVKIQLTTENVEVLYKSMVQIGEEFSDKAARSLQPLEKKQKQ